jgi:radical SAM superfamily enzyme YgiQ (UPF0313 family)
MHVLLDVQEMPSPVRISVRSHSIAVTLAQVPVYIFDRTGRLHLAYVGGRNYLRGLDNRVMEKWGRSQLGAPIRRDLPRKESLVLLEDVYAEMRRLQHAVSTGSVERLDDRRDDRAPLEEARRALEAVGQWDAERLEADGKRFLGIYKPVGILPPDQYLALVLQATEGCSHNRCTFCTFYRDREFRIKSVAEFEDHIAEVKAFFGPAVSLRRTLFLADANAIVIPQRLLIPMMDLVNASFEIVPRGVSLSRYRRHHPGALGGVHAFVDAFTTRHKTVQHFSELAERNLRRVYIGLETGHDPLLTWLRKAGTSADVLEAVRNIRAGGVAVGVIVMLGIGGRQFSAQHVMDTVAILNAMELDGEDFVYFSEFVEQPGSNYRRIAAEEGVAPLNQAEVRAQMGAIRRGLRFPGESPRISVYDIREFIY